MNAPNTVSPLAGSGEARPYEPSMEEILASIRRIIADDQSLPGRSRAEEPEPAEFPRASVHVLRSEAEERVEPQAECEVAGLRPEGEVNAMVAHGPIAAPQHASPEIPGVVQSIAAHGTSPALSDRLEAIHNQGDLAKQEVATRMDGSDDYFDPPEEHDRPAALPADSTTLFSSTTNSAVASAFNVLAASRLADNSEDLLGMAREMIRPLLRSWLDENLPSMVERLVRDEIERVARGGR